MNHRNTAVRLGRTRLPEPLASQLIALKRGLRARTVAIILQAHTTGLDLQKLVAAAAEIRRLGVLLNQCLRVSRGTAVDSEALSRAANLVEELWS